MREEVVWTYLSSTEIAERLERLGTPVCPDTVRSLLKELGFGKRQAEGPALNAEQSRVDRVLNSHFGGTYEAYLVLDSASDVFPLSDAIAARVLEALAKLGVRAGNPAVDRAVGLPNPM